MFFNILRQKVRLAYRSPKWNKTRKEHLALFPCCAACGSCEKPEVHHIIPVHLDASKELDESNLITLCDKYCHFIFGHLMNWKSYNKNILTDADAFYRKIRGRPS